MSKALKEGYALVILCDRDIFYINLILFIFNVSIYISFKFEFYIYFK